MSFTPNDYTSYYQDALSWERVILDSPVFNEAGRDAAIKELWVNYWKGVHKLQQSRKGKMLHITEARMDEGIFSGNVTSMQPCAPVPRYSNVHDVPVSPNAMPGTASGLPNVNAALQRSVSGAGKPIELVMPTTLDTERMELRQSAMRQQSFPVPTRSQAPCRLAVSSDSSAVAHAPPEDSTAEIQYALALTALSGVTQARQQATPTPSDSPDLVAERNSWKESGNANALRRSRSTGTFPCLQGCMNKFFTRDRDRTRHYRTTHRANNRHDCPDCGASLSRPDVLRRHQRNGACKKPKGRTA